jgi:hypothetical protein
MVRLLRKLRTNKSQTKHPKTHEGKPRDKEPHAAPETGGPRNFYKEEENQDSADHAARANVISTATPPD